MSEYLNNRRNQKIFGKPPKADKVYTIPKVSEKKKKEMAAEKERLGGEDTDLVKWYKARIKHLSGRCNECGLVTETKIYKYAINHVCHLLAKRKEVAPSVKYHPTNWIELCQHHHNLLDKSNWEEIEKWGCWETIRDRLILVYPDIEKSELRHFPESVIKYMEKNNPFP